MDPISVLTIVATATKAIETCTIAGFGLNEIIRRWNEAPDMLSSIGCECSTIKQILENIKSWLERHEEELSTDHETFLNALSSCLIHCLATLQKLEHSTTKVSRWQRFKRSFNNDTLKECRDELRWHINAATSLRSTFDYQPSERRQRAQTIILNIEIHNSRSSRAGSSAGSILDDDMLVDEVDTLPGGQEYVTRPPKRNSLANDGVVPIRRRAHASERTNMQMSPTSNEQGNKRANPVTFNERESDPIRSLFPSSTSRQKICVYLIFLLLLPLIVLVIYFNGAVGIEADSNDEASKDALFTAAGVGSPAEVAKLLKRGVKPSIRDHNLWTPLHYAASNGSTETVRILLKYNDTGWGVENGGTTPLHLAARYGHTAAVQQILKLSGHNWDTERAIDQQAIEKIKTATQRNYDRQFEAFLQRKTFSARELAVIYGHTSTVHAFQSYSKGDSRHALSCACMVGNVDMVEFLWKHSTGSSGSQGSQVRWFPAPPLHLAVISGSRATVAFLLERGLQANHQSTNYMSRFFSEAYPPYSSPAPYAAVVGSAEMLIALERRRADLTALDHRLRTPLSYAVENLNVAAVELLVQRSGHVWSDKKRKADAISNPQIVQALGKIGFSIKGH